MSSSNRPSSKTRKRGSGSLFVLSRFALVLMIAGIIAVGSAYKLIDTTIIHGAEWVAKGDSTLNVTAPVPPLRGEILASDGSILATNLNYYDVRVDFRASRFRTAKYAHPDTLAALACSLHRYFPKRDTSEWRKYLARPLKTPRNKRSRAFLVAKAVPKSIADKIRHFPFFRISRNANYTGLSITPVLKRAYPYGDMAQLSIGRVGEVESGEIRGVSGLERALDTMLYGVPGVKRKRLFTSGEGYWQETAPQTGMGVRTTIDIRMQDILEYELGEMLLKAKAEWGTAILMEVSTGDIKAISNLERDPKRPSRYIEAMNRAVMAFEPGSVMKVMSMAVALNEGFAHPISRYYSIEGGGYPYLGHKRISDTHSPGSLPVSRFLEYSSNIGMVKLMMPHFSDDPNRFRAALADMGFFDSFNTGIALERPPYFPKLKIDNGGRLNLSRMVFGYTTMIPPLYTCAFYNAIANDGRFVRPRLVKGLRLPDGRDSTIDVSYVRDRILSSENAAILRRMMHDVVWEQGGTAKLLRNNIVEIAGKTGTCKVAREAPRDSLGRRLKDIPFKAGYIEGKYRVAFCGFFPYENPRYTCIVLVCSPQGQFRGPASSAGTVLKNTALKMYARGMLDENPSLASQQKEASDGPTVYASFNDRRSENLHKAYGLNRSRRIASPAASTEGVPDVHGIGLREALARLESAGYSVAFDGIGYVESQEPAAGTKASPGTRVRLRLRHLE